jgi:hypothetical protein
MTAFPGQRSLPSGLPIRHLVMQPGDEVRQLPTGGLAVRRRIADN